MAVSVVLSASGTVRPAAVAVMTTVMARYDVRGFLIGTTVALALAGALIGKVAPGTLRSADGATGRRPSA